MYCAQNQIKQLVKVHDTFLEVKAEKRVQIVHRSTPKPFSALATKSKILIQIENPTDLNQKHKAI